MSDPTKECSSVISSIRALPSQAYNPIHCEYLFTKGVIVNNVWTPPKPPLPGKYAPPKKEKCPFETSLNVPKSTLNKDCTDSLTGGKQCGEPQDQIVSIPSLVLMVQNNIDCSITPVSIEDAFCNLTSDKKLCIPGECESNLCVDDPVNPVVSVCDSTYVCEDGTFGTVPFKPNGLLASVYNIALWQNYQFFTKKDVYEFIVYPYKNKEACFTPAVSSKTCGTEESEECKETGVPVLGTFPFCIGKRYSCACVNLLIHGAMNRDESSEGCIITNLHWVGVKIYFKNKEGHVCPRNPASVHIQANSTDPLKHCFKPYFATTRPILAEYERTTDSCPPSGVDCKQQFGPSVIGKCGTYPNYPIPPCPITNTPYDNPCASSKNLGCEVIDLIWVNDCIDFDEFTCFQTCNIFIVLLPIPVCKSIIC
jgi:hypothetical protein